MLMSMTAAPEPCDAGGSPISALASRSCTSARRGRVPRSYQGVGTALGQGLARGHFRNHKRPGLAAKVRARVRRT